MAAAARLAKARADRFDHLPPEVVTRARVRTSRLLPPQADAMTVGRTVLVRPGHDASDTLLAHELVHVRQWREYGWFGFLRRYLGAYLANLVRLRDHMAAYRAIPLEAEARAAAATWKARHP